MKKLLFSLVMMFALVIVAGTAMAQTNSTPIPGGTYNYTISGITSVAGATVSITYSGSGASFSAITPANISANASSSTLTFKTTYTTSATPGRIRVTLKDALSNCTNFIEMQVTPTALPVYTVSITTTSTTPICQTTTSAPTLGTAASAGQTNTLQFTVTPNVTNLSGSTYTYTYTVNLAGAGLSNYSVVHASGAGTYNTGSGVVNGSGTGVSPTPDVYTVTFDTTTGISGVTIPGSITSGGSITVNSGGNLYNASAVSTAVPVVVSPLPSIGGFN